MKICVIALLAFVATIGGAQPQDNLTIDQLLDQENLDILARAYEQAFGYQEGEIDNNDFGEFLLGDGVLEDVINSLNQKGYNIEGDVNYVRENLFLSDDRPSNMHQVISAIGYAPSDTFEFDNENLRRLYSIYQDKFNNPNVDIATFAQKLTTDEGLTSVYNALKGRGVVFGGDVGYVRDKLRASSARDRFTDRVGASFRFTEQ